MIVGFTGTRKGMTGSQTSVVTKALRKASEVHHGDCIGADEQCHVICQELDIPIVIHPPEEERLRAFCEGAARVEPPRPYLVRDRIIVDKCQLLLACPSENDEPGIARGQGTWSTVRYARRTGRLFRIVWPDMEWLDPLL